MKKKSCQHDANRKTELNILWKADESACASPRNSTTTDLRGAAVAVTLEQVLAHQEAGPVVDDEGADDAGDHEHEDDGALVVHVHQVAPVHLPEAEDVAAPRRQACVRVRVFCRVRVCTTRDVAMY